MGRGRAKAKQTKVARQLKYGTIHSDLGALQAELSTTGHADDPSTAPASDEAVEDDETSDDDDPYASYYDEEEDEPDEPVRRAR